MYSNNGAVFGLGEEPQPQYGEAGFDMEAALNPRVLEPAADWLWTDADQVASEYAGEPSGGSAFNWGGFLTPILGAGLQIGTAYARQELLAPSTYVINPKTGQIAVDSSGHPILANSSEGVRIATAMKTAGVGGLPSWVMPVAVAGGLLAIGLLVMKRGRR
jgi:hypothetical protein